MGVDHVRFDYQHPDCAVDLSHPRFGIDHNRCVLCTRCVRACDEIEGAHTWDVAGRGTKSRVITDMNQPWGTSPTLHLVRQVPAGVPDRRDLRAGLDRRRVGARPRNVLAFLVDRAGEEAMERLRLATAWLGGCSGCHMSFLDLDEFLIDLAVMADLVYSPIIDVKRYPDSVDVALVEGAVANQDHLELIHDDQAQYADAHLLRRLCRHGQRHGPAKLARQCPSPSCARSYLEQVDVQAQIPQ